MGLAADRAETSYLARVVDAVRFSEHPPAVGGDQVIEVLHGTGKVGEEGVLCATGERGAPDGPARGVDGVGVAARPAQGAQIASGGNGAIWSGAEGVSGRVGG